MTAWTEANRDELMAAIASGALTVKYSNGTSTREVTYQNLSAMRSLLAEMNRALTPAAQRTPYALAAHRKGT